MLGHLPEGVELVAISKYHPNEDILPAYEAGQRIFGESHEQELRQKVETLPRTSNGTSSATCRQTR